MKTKNLSILMLMFLAIIGLGISSCNKEEVNPPLVDTGSGNGGDTNNDTIVLQPQIGNIFEENGFKYKVLSDKTVEIFEIDAETMINAEGLLTIPEVTTGGVVDSESRAVNIEGGLQITSIAAGLLANNMSVKSVDMPSITTIGARAFFETPLKSLNLENVKTIGSAAFKNCSDLASVEMKNVDTIESSAFYNCIALETAKFENVKVIKDSAFYCIHPDNLPSILSTIDISNVETINKFAFASCYELTEVNIPKAIFVGARAFSYCTSLTKVKMTSIEEVKAEAFSNTFALQDVDCPKSFKYVGTDYVYEFDSLPSGSRIGSFVDSKWIPEEKVDNENTPEIEGELGEK